MTDTPPATATHFSSHLGRITIPPRNNCRSSVVVKRQPSAQATPAPTSGPIASTGAPTRSASSPQTMVAPDCPAVTPNTERDTPRANSSVLHARTKPHPTRLNPYRANTTANGPPE